MNPKDFSAQYFISVGEKNCYFTLRETYLHTRYIPGEGSMGNAIVNGVYQGSVVHEVRSYHIQNLSQDATEAFEKAKKFSEANCIRLTSTLEGIQQELNEIKRATAEQLAERQAKIQANLELQEQWRKEHEEFISSWLAEGKYPFGAHYGKKFEEAPASYITWLVEAIDTFEDGSNIKRLATAVKEKCADLVLPKPVNNVTVGEIGKRQSFEVKVIRVTGYFTDFGWCNCVTMIEKETGACMVSKGAFKAETGEELKIKATVKEFSEYKGQTQTVIQRVKVEG